MKCSAFPVSIGEGVPAPFTGNGLSDSSPALLVLLAYDLSRATKLDVTTGCEQSETRRRKRPRDILRLSSFLNCKCCPFLPKKLAFESRPVTNRRRSASSPGPFRRTAHAKDESNLDAIIGHYQSSAISTIADHNHHGRAGKHPIRPIHGFHDRSTFPVSS